MTISIKFWGVRGSVPSPLTPNQVYAKVAEAIRRSKAGEEIPFEVSSTYGGNTTCVEINVADELFICDMGTGVRGLGQYQTRQLIEAKKRLAHSGTRPRLHGTILQSHVHWDHIQGVPFWSPLFLPRRAFDCKFSFFGGKSWDSKLDLVYRGQMSPPEFPVNLEELEQTAMALQFETIYDAWHKKFGDDWEWRKTKTLLSPMSQPHRYAMVTARKLFHPQETFGYRITEVVTPPEGTTYQPAGVAFTTDHEPYAAGIPLGLLELVQGVDVWVTDCQYSHDEYKGIGGPQKMGWGHSFPEYIAQVAKEAKPKKIITTHHDPDADDDRILSIARQVQDLSGIETVPAYEGLTVSIETTT